MASISLFFFFNDTATTEIYTLSLHDALPISPAASGRWGRQPACRNRPRHPQTAGACRRQPVFRQDRKSTRLNSSHGYISYAVFCLKKKNQNSKQHEALSVHLGRTRDIVNRLA